MKKIFLIAILLIIVIFSCDSGNEQAPEFDDLLLSCNVSDPINDLDWLNDIYVNLKNDPGGFSQIKLIRYEGVVLISVQSAWEGQKGMVYDCKGKSVLADWKLSYDQIIDKSQVINILYTKN